MHADNDTERARIIAHYTRPDYLNDTFIVGSYDPAQVVNRVEHVWHEIHIAVGKVKNKNEKPIGVALVRVREG